MNVVKMMAATPVGLVLTGLLLIACQSSETPTSQPPIESVATSTMVMELVEIASITPLPLATLTGAPTPIPPMSTATAVSAQATASPPKMTPGTGNADVLFVRAAQADDGRWSFSVTVEHPDTGWEDYADGWDVVLPDGTVLKPDSGNTFTRLLAHPHVDDQPFTRSQPGILIPSGVETVTVRAHDLADGYGGREVLVDLTAASGPDFDVQRIP